MLHWRSTVAMCFGWGVSLGGSLKLFVLSVPGRYGEVASIAHRASPELCPGDDVSHRFLWQGIYSLTVLSVEVTFVLALTLGGRFWPDPRIEQAMTARTASATHLPIRPTQSALLQYYATRPRLASRPFLGFNTLVRKQRGGSYHRLLAPSVTTPLYRMIISHASRRTLQSRVVSELPTIPLSLNSMGRTRAPHR